MAGRDKTLVSGDEGSAVVEFTLVSVLLIFVFLGVVQLGLTLFVRNTLVACAAEGARYAANADRTPEDGVAKARDLITASLPDSYAEDVSAGYDDVAGAPTVYVEVQAEVPLVGWLVGRRFAVRGHVLEEGA